MKIRNLHLWDVSYKEAFAIQERLKTDLTLCDRDIPRQIQRIAGADISYTKGDNRFFATVVLLSFPSLEIIEEASCIHKVHFPYIPGLLTFREGPALLKAFAKLKHEPDIILFDGHGTAHPRGIGLASHMGLWLDKPTIGCAKKKLVGTFDNVGNERGDYSLLTYKNRTVGAALRTKKNVKPIFVSQGHKIGLKRAVDVTLCCCSRYRLPEPTRRAHCAVNKIRTEYIASA